MKVDPVLTEKQLINYSKLSANKMVSQILVNILTFNIFRSITGNQVMVCIYTFTMFIAIIEKITAKFHALDLEAKVFDNKKMQTIR